MLEAQASIRLKSLIETIEWMTEHGSSLILNWGEDTGRWEVDWISGGKRFQGESENLWCALVRACRALDEAEQENSWKGKEG